MLHNLSVLSTIVKRGIQLTTKKEPLNAERVIRAAVDLADEIGMEAFTIRKLAGALDVGPMSIYHYVATKDEIVDGMVEFVFSQIALPSADVDWRTAIRARCISARAVLNRHPWAAPLMETRMNPGPANLGHHDAVLGCLRGGGLSIQLTAHAYAVLDAFVYGFAFEEATLPTDDDGGMTEATEQIIDVEQFASVFPHLAELATEHVFQPGYSFGDSFEFGLDLIIDGVARAAAED